MMKESEIRPKDLFDKYLELSRQDIKLIDRGSLVSIACPGCGGSENRLHLEKNSFTFVRCSSCYSVFCSPRPSAKNLDDFYQNSISSNFWSKEFFPKVAEARREKMFKPRAEKIMSLLQEKSFSPKSICDVGAGYGVLLEELRVLSPEREYFAIEPGDELARVCRSKNFETLQTTCEKALEWEGKFDFVVCSEVIEHVFSPSEFVESLKRLLKPGGAVLITGLGYEGYDILTLKEKSQSIFPPHHINFLSVKGFEALFKSSGFKEVAVTTPGKLDVDIVINSDSSNDFVQTLARRGSEFVEKFQALLVEAKMSSHVWVFAQL